MGSSGTVRTLTGPPAALQLNVLQHQVLFNQSYKEGKRFLLQFVHILLCKADIPGAIELRSLSMASLFSSVSSSYPNVFGAMLENGEQVL